MIFGSFLPAGPRDLRSTRAVAHARQSAGAGAGKRALAEGTYGTPETPAMKAALLLLLGCADAQSYDYSLEDLNRASVSAGEMVGPSYFPGKITMHYFGHQS